MAFRAGAVDMTSDQLAISANAITLPSARTDINIMLPDAGLENWDADLKARSLRTPSRARQTSSGGTPGAGRGHLARQSDITLPQAQYDTYEDDRGSMDILMSSGNMGIASGEFDPDGGLDLFGDDAAAREASATAGPSGQRRDSDGRLVDADGNIVEHDSLSSIGVGRDAASEASQSRLGLGDDYMADFDGGVDFTTGPDMSVPLDAGGDNSLNVTDPNLESQLALDDMTPRTKQQVQEAAQKRAADAAAKGSKAKKQLQDRVTELDESQQGGPNALGKRNVDDIVAEQSYLPRSRAYGELLELYNNPSGLFGSSKDGMINVLAGSDLNLAAELSNMFVVDLDAVRAAKRARKAATRPRASEEEDISAEVGRRATPANDTGVDFQQYGDNDQFDFGAGDAPEMPGMDLDQSGDATGLTRKSDRLRELAQQEDPDQTIQSQLGGLPALDRLTTPFDQGDLEIDSATPTSSRLLAAFDAAGPSDAAAVDPTTSEATAAQVAAEEAQATQLASAQGWSKNTVRAQRVLRSQLQKTTPARQGEVSLQKLGANASRRAAAGFFFELLVLGTKDQIELEQEEAYGDITIKGKEGLWA